MINVFDLFTFIMYCSVFWMMLYNKQWMQWIGILLVANWLLLLRIYWVLDECSNIIVVYVISFGWILDSFVCGWVIFICDRVLMVILFHRQPYISILWSNPLAYFFWLWRLAYVFNQNNRTTKKVKPQWYCTIRFYCQIKTCKVQSEVAKFEPLFKWWPGKENACSST